MEKSGFYAINNGNVVFEKFDDEYVLINLENGNYFSIRLVAGVVWRLLTEGHSVTTVVTAIGQKFEVSSDQLQTDVETFVSQLLTEGLFVEGSADSFSNSTLKVTEEISDYKAPMLEVYSDMQDLILLDPVHEVDDTGWPNVKKEESESSDKV